MLTLRLVFHPTLRQTEEFARSVLALFSLGLAVPDHSTLSRRGRAFAGRQPGVRAGTGPVHLVLDSTGLELFGQGEAGQGSGRAAAEIPAEGSGVRPSTAACAHVLVLYDDLALWQEMPDYPTLPDVQRFKTTRFTQRQLAG